MSEIKKEKSQNYFEDSLMRVEGNVIISENNLIQITNVTQVWTGPVPKKPLPYFWLAVLAILGIGAIGLRNVFTVIVGVLLLAICTVIIYMHFSADAVYALNLELNSGRTYSFFTKRTEFVNKSFEFLTEIFEQNNYTGNYLINFGNGTIVNQSDNVKTGSGR